MHPSALSHSSRVSLARLAHLGGLGLWAFAILTVDLRPHGVLNLVTWLIVGMLLAAAPSLGAVLAGWRTSFGAWADAHGLRLPLLVLGLGLGVLVAIRFAVRLQLGGAFSGITPLLWSLAWMSLLGAVWPRQRAIAAWLRAHRAELLSVAALTLVTAGLRFWRLGVVPNIINGDEGLIGLWAEDTGVATGALTTPFAAMDGVGVLYLTVMRAVFWVFGPSAFALRLLPAIAGTLAIPATYLLARHLLGVRGAWVAATLLAFSHVHIHFSRTVAVSYIYATLFVPLALYFLLSGVERRSPLRLTLAAVMVGLHINAYVDGWVWLVLLGLLLVAWSVVDWRLIWGSRAALALFAASLAVVVAPMVIWGVQSPDAFSSRLAVDGTFSSGWLWHEAAATGKHPAWIVLELFGHALGTFTARPFIDFYGIGVPTLDPVTGVLWCAGLLLALWRTRSTGMLLVNGWFWGGVVALGVVTIPPSSYHYRLLVVLPAACILAAIAFEAAARLAARRLPAQLVPASARSYAALAAPVLLIAIVARLNLATYYGSFATSCVYHGPATRQAGLLSNELAGRPRETTVVVLPNEHGFRYGPHRSVDFLSGRMAFSNVDAPLDTGRPAELSGDFAGGLLVAAVPERRHELEQVRAWYPGGKQWSLLDCGSEVLVLYAWRP